MAREQQVIGKVFLRSAQLQKSLVFLSWSIFRCWSSERIII
jgi:hypothetical protein